MIGTNSTQRPRSLPLRGPDYRLEVDRQGIQNDLTIEKRSDRIEVDGFGQRDLTLRIDENIDIDAFGVENDVNLRQRSNGIDVDRFGIHNDCDIRQRGNTIEIDRSGIKNDVTYTFSGDRLEIDRQGIDRDVTVTRRGEKIEIDGYGIAADVSVESPFPLDPVAWEPQLGLSGDGWTILNGWFEAGQPSVDDLVILSENGKVEVLDHLLT